MGTRVAWTGLALMLVTPEFNINGIFVFVGAVILTVGVVMMWLNK